MRSEFTAVRFDCSALDLAVPEVDIVGVCLHGKCHKKLYMFVIYIPPATHLNIIDLFFDYCANLLGAVNNNLMIMSDFNCPSYASESKDKLNCSHDNFLNFFNFMQSNFVYNDNIRLLDLVLTNASCRVIKSDEPLVVEDVHHPALPIEFDCFTKPLKILLLILYRSNSTLKKANYILLYDLILKTNWSILCNIDYVNATCDMFYTIFIVFFPNLFQKLVPNLAAVVTIRLGLTVIS